MFYVKKYFFGNFFGQFPSNTVCTSYTALLDIPKDRFDRKHPTFVFLNYYLNICEENRNAIKSYCSGVRPAEAPRRAKDKNWSACVKQTRGVTYT